MPVNQKKKCRKVLEDARRRDAGAPGPVSSRARKVPARPSASCDTGADVNTRLWPVLPFCAKAGFGTTRELAAPDDDPRDRGEKGLEVRERLVGRGRGGGDGEGRALAGGGKSCSVPKSAG